MAVFQAHPTGRISSGQTPNTLRDYNISHLAWKRLGIPQEEPEEEASEKGIWAVWLALLLYHHDPDPDPDPDPDAHQKMDGFERLFLSLCKCSRALPGGLSESLVCVKPQISLWSRATQLNSDLSVF